MFRRRLSNRTISGLPMKGLTLHANIMVAGGSGSVAGGSLALGNNSVHERQLLHLKMLVITHFLHPAMENDIDTIKKNYHLQQIIINKFKALRTQKNKDEVEAFLIVLQIIINAMHLDFENTNLLVKLYGDAGVSKLIVQTPAILLAAPIHVYHILFGEPPVDEETNRIKYDKKIIKDIRTLQDLDPLVLIDSIKNELHSKWGHLYLDPLYPEEDNIMSKLAMLGNKL